MYCSLLWLTLHFRVGINISYLSISGIVANGRCYISHCYIFFSFLPTVFLNCLLCSALILQTHINLTSFLIKLKFISFPIRDFAHLLSHYYYCYNYYFYYVILIFFYMFCFAIITHFHCLVI